jgi:hypothetical protein
VQFGLHIKKVKRQLRLKIMPAVLGILIAGGIIGALVAPTANNNLTLFEGMIAGVALGAGAAAIYFAVKKIQ